MIDGVQVSLCPVAVVSGGKYPACSIARRGRGYLRRLAKLMSIELQIAEVNQSWISDLRFGIEESMLEAGAVVDWGFSIWDAS